MYIMTFDQFEMTEHEGKPMLLFVKSIGARNGSAKTKQGGIKFIKRYPVRNPIDNLEILGSLLNPISLVFD